MLFRKKFTPPNSTNVDPLTKKHQRGLRTFLLILSLVILGGVSWVSVAGFLAFKNISAKNSGDQSSFFKFEGNIKPDQLVREGDSRINIALLGADATAGLTDSISIVSIDPINKRMAMLSVPRDLSVYNSAEKRKTKINEVYNSGVSKCLPKAAKCDPNVDAGGELIKQTLSDTLDITVSYFARVDFQGLTKIVDSLGGIQIYVDKAINDPLFPSKTGSGYDPFRISTGMQKMNGDVALKYARSRQTTSDFDRSRRQQQVVNAIREKALTLNFLSNPKKVTDLITAVGRNFRTDLQSSELLSLIRIVNDVDGTKTASEVLDNGPTGPLKSSVNSIGQYILVPKLGESDWSDVHSLVRLTFPEPYLVKEGATFKIVNQSGSKTKLAEAEKYLTSYGYNIVKTEESTVLKTSTSVEYFKDFPYTSALLKKRLSITGLSKGKTDSTEDFIIYLGSSFATKSLADNR